MIKKGWMLSLFIFALLGKYDQGQDWEDRGGYIETQGIQYKLKPRTESIKINIMKTSKCCKKT